MKSSVSILALKTQHQINVIRDLVIQKLPQPNYNVLKYLIEFLNLVRFSIRRDSHIICILDFDLFGYESDDDNEPCDCFWTESRMV